MTREELTALLTLPDHKFVEVQFERPKATVILKCGFELTTQQELDELGQVVAEFYTGTDYAVVRAADIPGSNLSGYLVGKIVKVIENYNGSRIDAWVVQKVDNANHQEYVNQETRITRLHEKLDIIWDGKDGTSKLDILLDEYIAAEQAEAEAVNETGE